MNHTANLGAANCLSSAILARGAKFVKRDQQFSTRYTQ